MGYEVCHFAVPSNRQLGDLLLLWFDAKDPDDACYRTSKFYLKHKAIEEVVITRLNYYEKKPEWFD